MGVDRDASLMLQMPQSEIHLKQLLYGSWKEGSPYAECVPTFSWFVLQCWILHRSWLLVSHPTNLWTRRGCRLSYPAGDLQKRVTTCIALMEVRQQKEEAGGGERESASLHTAWLAPPNVAPFEMALPQKVDLGSATWMLLVYFSTCRTWNTQHLICSRDMKYLNLITSSTHSKDANIYFGKFLCIERLWEKRKFVGIFISNTWMLEIVFNFKI